MTQGWVVYGGMRHAEPQREMFRRSYLDPTVTDLHAILKKYTHTRTPGLIAKHDLEHEK